MEDVLVVDVLERQHRLGEPSEQLLLREARAAPPSLLDALGQLPALAEVHDDTEPACGAEAVAVAHDEGVPHRGQQATLLGGILSLLL